MNKILLAAAVLAVLASQLFPASAIQAAGPVAPFDLPARRLCGEGRTERLQRTRALLADLNLDDLTHSLPPRRPPIPARGA